MNGLFINIEGAEFTGKSTVTKLVVRDLNERRPSGMKAVATTEPSTGWWGRRIRRVLKGELARPSPIQLAIWYAYDRLDHMRLFVFPEIGDGVEDACEGVTCGSKVVVSDRGLLSSIAYQHGGEGIPLQTVMHLNRYAPRPDLTFVLLASEETCKTRQRARGGAPELFDGDDVQKRVREVYRRAPSYLTDREIVFVNAEPAPEVVANEIVTYIVKTLDERAKALS